MHFIISEACFELKLSPSVHPGSQANWFCWSKCFRNTCLLQAEPSVRGQSLDELDPTKQQAANRMWGNVVVHFLEFLQTAPINILFFCVHSQSICFQRGHRSVQLRWAGLRSDPLHQRGPAADRRALQPGQHLLPLSGNPTGAQTSRWFPVWFIQSFLI